MSNTKKDESLYITYGGDFKSASDLGIIEGRAIYFGSPQETDQSSFKDYFDETTFIHPETTFVTPLFLEHCQTSFTDPIGKATVTKKEDGWYAVGHLDMTLPIVKEKFSDIKNLQFGFSSGSAGHTVKRVKMGDSNHIVQWPFSELSVVRNPAEKNAKIWQVKSLIKSLDEYYGTVLPEPDIEEEPEINPTILQILMDIITQLLEQNSKKQIEEFLIPQLNELKTLLTEIKESSPLPIGSTNDEELTVLKSENESLKTQLSELQSSFEEKEALLSTKDALLSETQAELEAKTQDITTLEEALNVSQSDLEAKGTEVETLNSRVELLTKAQDVLAKTTNFNK